jgi:hypothetical protein
MKRSKAQKTLDKNSLVMRNLVRHKMPPPTTFFVDKKKKDAKAQCRK